MTSINKADHAAKVAQEALRDGTQAVRQDFKALEDVVRHELGKTIDNAKAEFNAVRERGRGLYGDLKGIPTGKAGAMVDTVKERFASVKERTGHTYDSSAGKARDLYSVAKENYSRSVAGAKAEPGKEKGPEMPKDPYDERMESAKKWFEEVKKSTRTNVGSTKKAAVEGYGDTVTAKTRAGYATTRVKRGGKGAWERFKNRASSYIDDARDYLDQNL